MPTRVKAHWSYTKTGKKYWVETFVRKGPEHTAKWRRAEAKIRAKERKSGYSGNPYAIATAQFERSGKKVFRRK